MIWQILAGILGLLSVYFLAAGAIRLAKGARSPYFRMRQKILTDGWKWIGLGVLFAVSGTVVWLNLAGGAAFWPTSKTPSEAAASTELPAITATPFATPLPNTATATSATITETNGVTPTTPAVTATRTVTAIAPSTTPTQTNTKAPTATASGTPTPTNTWVALPSVTPSITNTKAPTLTPSITPTAIPTWTQLPPTNTPLGWTLPTSTKTKTP